MWEYDTAQICLNGHIVNSWATLYPQVNLSHCRDCGSETITSCPGCRDRIRGGSMSDGISWNELSSAPAFCHHCGAPYPWTVKRLEAARALAAEIQGLDEADRAILTTSLDDLVRDTPDATVAAVRFKKIVSKAGGTVAQGFKDILIDIVSDTIKKLIWP